MVQTMTVHLINELVRRIKGDCGRKYTIKKTDISCDVTCDSKWIRCETNQSSNDKRLNCDKKLTPQK
ncbi:hypothetical protein BLOT_009357 [Blomia tropicalis]|nr:hypothetical protein BLOT_009357 [Blomia tropicalis]